MNSRITEQALQRRQFGRKMIADSDEARRAGIIEEQLNSRAIERKNK